MKGQLIKDEHYERRLWDKDTSAELRAARARRTVLHSQTMTKPVYMLRGVATCTRCGTLLYITNASSLKPSYTCTHGHNNGQRTCKRNTVPGAHLEKVDSGTSRSRGQPAPFANR
jgi:hypothetical protein